MSRFLIITLSLIAVVVFVAGDSNVSWPTPIRHVHLIRQVRLANGYTNFLFRGGTPTPNDSGPFMYDELIDSMKIAAAVEGVFFDTSKVFIRDVNLENIDMYTDSGLTYDAQRVRVEYDFFNKNPHLGSMQFWYTNGTDSNATMITNLTDNGFLNFLIQTFPAWDSDHLNHRIPALHQMLYTSYGATNTAIYGHWYVLSLSLFLFFFLFFFLSSKIKNKKTHDFFLSFLSYFFFFFLSFFNLISDCGCDRTGETFGSYAMTYQGHSWKETNERNKIIAGRPMCCSNYRNMQWYCLWLNFQHPEMGLNCMDNQPCDNSC